jgi:hypothetical protein
MESSIAFRDIPVTWMSVFGQLVAEAGEPATSIQAATIAIAQANLLERGTRCESSGGAHAL